MFVKYFYIFLQHKNTDNTLKYSILQILTLVKMRYFCV